MSDEITTHEADAVTEIGITPFKSAPRLKALAEVTAAQVQELEGLFCDLISERYLSTAVGKQIDQLGKIFGEGRGDLDDDDYRALLHAKAATLASNGSHDTILRIVNLVTGVNAELFQQGDPGFCVQWEISAHTSGALAPRLWALLERAKRAGIPITVIEGVTGAFRFDSGPGFDQGKLGTVIGQTG